jgi:hypothetical protein
MKRSMLGDQSLHDVFNPLAKASRQRPRARLAQNVKCAPFVQHFKMRSLALSIKPKADHRLAHVQIFQRDLGKPIWQFRIEQ